MRKHTVQTAAAATKQRVHAQTCQKQHKLKKELPKNNTHDTGRLTLQNFEGK
jgi:hypothetical protein